MQFLETRIPPPLVALALASVMWLLFHAEPCSDTPGSWRSVAVAATSLSSGALAFAAFVAFWRAKTTVNPLKPDRASTLITYGVYHLTRNPMYVSLLLLLLSYAIYLWSVPALVGPVAFIVYITRFQIIPEERALEAKFGVTFDEYKRRVRRWL